MKQIIFNRIEIENFLSVGKVPVIIDFKTGINLITGINHDKNDSKNGVGKTTIADALYFCLFGTTIRDIKREEIVNNITKKKCKTKLYFDIIDNKITIPYIITRGILPTALELTINGVDCTESSIIKTTKTICEIIDADVEVFKNSVIMTVNGTVPFMAQKKVEKRKFCEGLFGLGVFQDMLLESRKQANDIKGNLLIEEAKYEEITNTLEIYKQQKTKRDSFKKERTNKLRERNHNNIKELSELSISIICVENKEIKDYENNIKLLKTKQVMVQTDITKAIRSIAINEEKTKNKTANILNLNTLGDSCDKCSRPFTTDDIHARDIKIKEEETELNNITKTIKDTNDQLTQLNELVDKCIRGVDKQKNNIELLNKIIAKNNNVNDRINQLNTWNSQIERDIEALDKESEDFNDIIKATTKRSNDVHNELKKLKDKLSILDSIKHIVSEEGVKSYIIKKVLKVLNSRLMYYLQKLDAPCRFKFNEYFDEQIITDRGEECSYHNFSSGEKKRIDLAILFTFMDIRRLQGNTSINIAFYDEILDTSLDDIGIAAFLSIIKERVDKYNEACYIITHKNTAIQSVTNDVLFLEKKNGVTTITTLK